MFFFACMLIHAHSICDSSAEECFEKQTTLSFIVGFIIGINLIILSLFLIRRFSHSSEEPDIETPQVLENVSEKDQNHYFFFC